MRQRAPEAHHPCDMRRHQPDEAQRADGQRRRRRQAGRQQQQNNPR